MLNSFDLWFDGLGEADQRLLYSVFKAHRQTIEQQCKRGLATGLVPCWQRKAADLDNLKRLVSVMLPGSEIRFIDVDSATDESTRFYLLFLWPREMPGKLARR